MTHLTAFSSRRYSEANFQKHPVQRSKRLSPPRHCHSLLEVQACISLISVAFTGYLRLGHLKGRKLALAHRLRLGSARPGQWHCEIFPVVGHSTAEGNKPSLRVDTHKVPHPNTVEYLLGPIAWRGLSLGTALQQFAASTPQLCLASECTPQWLQPHYHCVPSSLSCSFSQLIPCLLPHPHPYCFSQLFVSLKVARTSHRKATLFILGHL